METSAERQGLTFVSLPLRRHWESDGPCPSNSIRQACTRPIGPRQAPLWTNLRRATPYADAQTVPTQAGVRRNVTLERHLWIRLIRARRSGKLSDYRGFFLVATAAAIYRLRVPDAAGLKEKFDVAAVMGDPDGSRWNLSHGQTSSWRVGGKPLALR